MSARMDTLERLRAQAWKIMQAASERPHRIQALGRDTAELVAQWVEAGCPDYGSRVEAIPGDFVTLSAAPSVVYPREVTRDVENRPIAQMVEGGPLWVIGYDKAHPLKLTEQPE